MLTSKFNIHSPPPRNSSRSVFGSKYLCDVSARGEIYIIIIISQRLNRLASKIDGVGVGVGVGGGEKCTIITEGRTLFSRSHLNISFKSIDLLCCDLHGPILCN